jgi:hypothetical protein
MHVRAVLALAGAASTAWPGPAAAQRTGDRARLVFTISGAYIPGRGLWTVPRQPLQEFPPADTLFLNRSVSGTLGAGLSATYYPGDKLGLTADAFLVGLGYDDTCQLVAPQSSARNAQVCASIDRQNKSAAAVILSTGGIFRIGSREYISPFVRASLGLLFTNQSSILVSGTSNSGALLIVYDDDKSTRVRPALGIGAGATVAIAKGYHLRMEVRDNIAGIETVTGPSPAARLIPPHETKYKHLLSLLLGIDVILERQRGRRY